MARRAAVVKHLRKRVGARVNRKDRKIKSTQGGKILTVRRPGERIRQRLIGKAAGARIDETVSAIRILDNDRLPPGVVAAIFADSKVRARRIERYLVP